MKILFYVEPYPIRESFVGFYWVAEKIIQMISDEKLKLNITQEHDFKVLCSRHIHNRLASNFPNVDENIIGLTKSENDFLEKNFDADWNSKATEKWEGLLKGQGAISDYFVDVLKRVYNKFDFDVVVYWGTNGAVKAFSRDYGVPSIAMELGCTRVPFFESVYFDFQGVNGASYLHNFSLENFVPEFSLEECRSLLPVSKKYNKTFADGPYDYLDYSFANEIYSSVGKNVLIPLQLMDDVNVLVYSKYNSMLSFLKDVIPKLTAAGYKCFVKPHPGARHRYINKKDHEDSLVFCNGYSDVVWLNDFVNGKSLLSLYNKMDACAVINSSVGFEMMLFGKPVINFGTAPYTLGKQLTLDDFISGYDHYEYERNVEKIVNLLLFNYLHIKEEAFDFYGMLKAIKLNVSLSKFQDSPDLLANAVFRNAIQTDMDYLFYNDRSY